MALTYSDKASWLETIWQALHCHRESSIPEGNEAFDNQWSDITTAMAWISENMGIYENE
jgi:hypothetical protein